MNDQLVQKIRQCPTLPSLPTIAMQVLDLAQKSNVDIAEIARVISKDPALSGKILRTVNSSFYGRSQHVSTISHALVILGLQSVKTLVLGFSLVSNLTKNKARGFKHIVYWRRSIYAATAARSIAAKIGLVQQEEAFLSALLMDIGMLVLDLVEGEKYAEVFTKAKSHCELPAIELAELGMTHAQVGSILAESWKLPPLLTAPISSHHSVDDVKEPALKRLAEVVSVASLCADVFVDEEAAKPIADVRAAFKARFNIAEPECDKIMAEIGKRTKEVASLFEINIGSTADFDAVLKKANEALVELTLQSQQQATQLKQQNSQLKQQAVTDGLTGLANRARFDQSLAEHFAAHRAGGKPMALVMVDLDKFKSINDTHGHPAGDTVIKTVAKILRAAARKDDVAARYGGEEMALLMPGATRQMASTVAETIRRAIAAKPVQCPGKTIPVTASFGVSVLEPGSPITSPAHMIKAADLALYNAKHSGRNCVKVFAFKPQAQAA